jgi:protein-tyrosine phosphatase
MAEAIFRDRCLKAGRQDFVVSSMGIHGLDCKPASKLAQEVCMNHGIDLSAHRSRELVFEELEQSTLIFTMDPVQKEFIRIFFPRLLEKIFLFAAWPDQETRKSFVADPMGSGIKAYKRTFDIISGHIDRIYPVILQNYK